MRWRGAKSARPGTRAMSNSEKRWKRRRDCGSRRRTGNRLLEQVIGYWYRLLVMRTSGRSSHREASRGFKSLITDSSNQLPVLLRSHASLGRKPGNLPTPLATSIEQSVVQAIGSPLPKLDLVRRDTKAPPMRWQRNTAVWKASDDVLHARLELFATREHRALMRRPRPEPAA